MRALKALVTVLTTLLVIAFGVLVWAILRQAGPDEASSGPAADADVAASIDEEAPWQTLVLDQPAGTRVASITTVGSLVILHMFTGAPGQDERLLVVDPTTGTLMGTIAVTGTK